jgi:hypothetical protein
MREFREHLLEELLLYIQIHRPKFFASLPFEFRDHIGAKVRATREDRILYRPSVNLLNPRIVEQLIPNEFKSSQRAK